MADGGASAKATRILKKLLGKVDGLTEDHTAHGLRAGATDDMLLHRYCNIIAAIFRGNWEFEGDCVLFRYLWGKLFTSMSGKILARHEDPEQTVAYPDLSVIITDDNKQLLENFANTLFEVGAPQLHEDLKPYRDAMLASLLMYHHDVATKYSLQHVVVQRLVTVAVTLGKSHVHLCQWGQHIKEEYVRANASNLDRSGNINIRTERELRQVRDENSHLHHKVDNLHGTVEALQTTIQGMLETQKQCLYLLQNQCASQQSSPVGILGTNKKRRIDSDSSEPPAVEMPGQRMRSAFDLMNASANRIPNVERTASVL